MAKDFYMTGQWFNGKFWQPTTPVRRIIHASSISVAFNRAAAYIKKNVAPPRSHIEEMNITIKALKSVREAGKGEE